MARQQQTPKLQTTNQRDMQSYLTQLDDLLKRNTGSSTLIGEDTSSNIPFYMQGQAVRGQQQLGNSGMVAGEAPRIDESFGNRPIEELEIPPELTQDQPMEGSFDELFNTMQDTIYKPQEMSQEQKEQLYQQSGSVYGISSTADGGVLYNDNKIRYNDGTIRDYTDPQAQAISSQRDGSILYSDGSIRKQAAQEEMKTQEEATQIASLPNNRVLYSDGSVRFGDYIYEESGQPQRYEGAEGLSQAIFGKPDQYVTQEYGKPASANLGYRFHGGMDFRTRDLQGSARELRLPFDTVVVDIKQAGDGNPYGNSVLVELPNGYRMRLSHLDQLGNVQKGQPLPAHELLGMPGNTGNSTAQHLDVEYITPEGQRTDPRTFMFETKGEVVPIEGQGTPGEIASTQDLSNFDTTLNAIRGREPIASSVNQDQPIYNQPAPQQNAEFQSPLGEVANNAVQAVAEVPKQAGRVFADTVDAVNPTGEMGLGITELARGDREGAGQEINATGKALADKGVGTVFGNSPEGFAGIGEAVAGDLPSAGKEISATIERMNPTPRVDTGLSELLRGDIQGAKANFADTASRVGNRFSALPQQVASGIVKPAYADDGQDKTPVQTFTDNIKGGANSVAKYATQKAGEGIKDLANKGIDSLQSVFAPKQEEPKRAIGDVAGNADGSASRFSSLMDSAPSMSEIDSGGKVKDSFFKYGGGEMYKNFLNPNAKDKYGGALKLDSFNDSFYKDLGNISSVFGGSKDLGTATEKYIGNEKEKYKPIDRMGYEPDAGRMGYSDDYDRSEVDNYNKEIDKYNSENRSRIDSYNKEADNYNNELNSYYDSIRSSVDGANSIFTPMRTASAVNRFSKPQMSMANQISSSAQPSFSGSMSKAPQMSMSKAPQMSMASRPAPRPAPTPAPSRSAPQPQYRGGSSNSNGTSTGGMSIAPRSAPKPAPRPTPSKPAPKPQPQYRGGSSNSNGTSTGGMSIAPKPQSQPKKSVFSRASSFIRNVFRR